jgi:hypothetical protein
MDPIVPTEIIVLGENRLDPTSQYSNTRRLLRFL